MYDFTQLSDRWLQAIRKYLGRGKYHSLKEASNSSESTSKTATTSPFEFFTGITISLLVIGNYKQCVQAFRVRWVQFVTLRF